MLWDGLLNHKVFPIEILRWLSMYCVFLLALLKFFCGFLVPIGISSEVLDMAFKTFEDQVPPHPAVSTHVMPSSGACLWASQAGYTSRSTSSYLTPSWLCPQGKGFFLPTISQSNSHPSSPFNLNITSFRTFSFTVKCLLLWKLILALSRLPTEMIYSWSSSLSFKWAPCHRSPSLLHPCISLSNPVSCISKCMTDISWMNISELIK